MTARTGRPWLNLLLGALSVTAIVVAVLIVGPESGSQSAQTRTATAALGVVQSTASGSGNLQAANQLNVNFKTSGSVTSIEVAAGEHVHAGELLASINPRPAEVALEQAKANLESARATLSKTEAEGTTSTTSTTTTTSSSSSATATATATAATSAPAASRQPAESSTQSAATHEANLDSARAAVHSDELSIQSATESLADTRLYAPEAGIVAALSGAVGDAVSAASAGASSNSGAAAGSAAGTGGTGSSSGAGRGSGSSGSASSGTGSSSSTSNSASSAFIVLADLSSMQMIVPFSESDIVHIRRGQIATVAVNALSSEKLAAHVTSISVLSTSNSGVVSYDVTLQLEQTETGLKPGMSASAEVVTAQVENAVNVPSSAVTGTGSNASVTVLRGGKQVRRLVASGLVGNSTTQILSGLKAGEKVVLPQIATSLSSGAGITGGSGAGGLRGAGGGGGGFRAAFGGGLGGG